MKCDNCEQELKEENQSRDTHLCKLCNGEYCGNKGCKCVKVR